jgi:hypothetical protein
LAKNIFDKNKTINFKLCAKQTSQQAFTAIEKNSRGEALIYVWGAKPHNLASHK